MIISNAISFASDDVGNNYITAKTLKINTVYESDIESGDIDYYRIPISNDGKLKVFTSGDTDTSGQLLDFKQTVLVENDNDNKSNSNFFIESDVNPGIYYVSVSNHIQEGIGVYSLHVVFSTTDCAGPIDKKCQSVSEKKSQNINTQSTDPKQYSFEYKVSCVTEPRKWFGPRPNCESTECFSLPDNFFYIPPLTMDITSKNGDIPVIDSCQWWSTKSIELFDGFAVPNAVCVKARARGECYGCRGWANCVLRGKYMQLPDFGSEEDNMSVGTFGVKP